MIVSVPPHEDGEGELALGNRALPLDSAGQVQPLKQRWTARGVGNNMAQPVRVVVV